MIKLWDDSLKKTVKYQATISSVMFWPILNVAYHLETVFIVNVNPIFVPEGGSVITTTKPTAYPASKTCQLRLPSRGTFSSSVTLSFLSLYFPTFPTYQTKI